MLRICKSSLWILLNYLVTHFHANSSHLKWSCGHIGDLNWLVEDIILILAKAEDKALYWKLVFWRALTTFCVLLNFNSFDFSRNFNIVNSLLQNICGPGIDQIQDKLLLPIPNVFRRKTWEGLITVRFLELSPRDLHAHDAKSL